MPQRTDNFNATTGTGAFRDPGSIVTEVSLDAGTPLQGGSYQRGENPYAPGSMYRDLYENNPYQHQIRQETVWDRLSHSFGFLSDYDKAEINRKQAMAEYDAQLSQLKAQNEYDSAASQYQRMAAAGINPMLSGDVGPGSGSDFDNQVGKPTLDGTEGPEKTGRFLSGVIQTALSIYTSGISSAATKAAKDGQEIKNAKDMQDLAIGQANISLPSGKKFRHENGQLIDENGNPITFEMLEAASREGSPLLFSNARLNKNYGTISKLYKQSSAYREKLLQAHAGEKTAEKDLGLALADPMANDDAEYGAISELARIFADYSARYQTLEKQNDHLKETKRTDYLNEIDAKKMARAENATNENTVLQQERERLDEETYTKMMKALEEDGGTFSSILMFLLPMLRNSFMSGKVSFQKGPKGKTFGYH